LPGLSESVTVVSVVGRFLEHSRIYYFHNGGAEEYFIGSADCMKRNLEHRVEVLAPVEDPLSRETLHAVLTVAMTPNRNSWFMQSDGTYVRSSNDPNDRGCQQALYDWLAGHESSPKLLAARRRRRLGRRIARGHSVDGIA
jgi:polyphosphate kinase